MATYIIGDVQGCFDQLQALLKKIQFNPDQDRLGFTGDLVNRGPKSLETLRFIKSLDDPIVVLGNHDIFLLALAYGFFEPKLTTLLDEIIQAQDSNELLTWLRQQPLIHYDPKLSYVLTHAGIPPQWSVEQAVNYGKEVHNALRHDTFLDFLGVLEGDEPTIWKESLTGWDRLRYIVNAFTRMRFCTQTGELEFSAKMTTSPDPARFKPWFDWYQPSVDIIFGHWASLEGHCDNPKCYAIDTGCVWNNTLTAIRVEDREVISIKWS